jgi:hypothetical protein
MATKRSKVVTLVTKNKAAGYTDAWATQNPAGGQYWDIEVEGQKFYVWQSGENGTLDQLIELLKAVKKENKNEED